LGSNMYRSNKKYNIRTSAAFTLIEVLLATVLVGFAIVALMLANSSLTKTNAAGLDLSTSEFLIEQIRELTAMVEVVDPCSGTAVFGPEEAGLAAYDDLDDFDGAVFSPPIDAARQGLTDLAAFSQHITVDNVSGTDFQQVVAEHSSDFVRITTTITRNNETISSVTWLRTRY